VDLGILYPGRSGDQDLVEIGNRLGSGVRIHIANTPVPQDSARVRALTDLGSRRHLRIGLDLLAGIPVRAVMWACTSCSFLLGMEGMRDQANFLSTQAGVPASSTTLAMLAAVNVLRAGRVAVASPYPDHLAAEFVSLLRKTGTSVVSQYHWGGRTAASVAALEPAVFADWVERADSAEADAILVPETAVRAGELIEDLEARHRKPVVTANQATVWQALRMAGDTGPYDALGALFRVDDKDAKRYVRSARADIAGDGSLGFGDLKGL
jgi:maleate cis-trans isomerase